MNHSDTFIGTYFMRKISPHLTGVFIKTPITANQITFISFFLYILSAYFFSHNTLPLNICGGLILFVGNILDFVDGEVARAKNTSSKFGYWLDTIADRLGQIIIVTGIVLGQQQFLRDSHNTLIGFLAIFNIVIIGLLIIIKSKTVNTPAFKIGNMPHIGFTDFMIFIIFCAFINKLMFVLWIAALFFPLIWLTSLIKIIMHLNKYFAN